MQSTDFCSAHRCYYLLRGFLDGSRVTGKYGSFRSYGVISRSPRNTAVHWLQQYTDYNRTSLDTLPSVTQIRKYTALSESRSSINFLVLILIVDESWSLGYRQQQHTPVTRIAYLVKSFGRFHGIRATTAPRTYLVPIPTTTQFTLQRALERINKRTCSPYALLLNARSTI